MDNLVIKIRGKGGKHGRVPFSNELRKSLWRRTQRLSAMDTYIFGTKNNTEVTVRNLNRDFKILGKKVGIAGIVSSYA